MLRKVGLGLMAVLLLAGCGERGYRSYPPPAPPMLLRDVATGNAPQVFSYTHSLGLILPHGQLKQSFEQARDTCLHETALHCELVSASLTSGESRDDASMVVALPHDKVAVFEKKLTDSGATVQARTSNAENVTTQTSDIDRKITQLTAWRDRLAALAKRADVSVVDLMKIEAELSKVEADLAAALAEKRDNDKRVATELVNISFSENEPALAPVMRAFNGAGANLTDSAAAAIEFLIRIIPWLPIVGGAILLIRWLWFLARRRKPA